MADRDLERDLHSVAFPTLDDADLDAVRAVATCRTYRDGEALFRAGDRGFKFHVVRAGKIKIVDDSGDERQVVAVHGPGEFTGDVSNLAGNPAVITALADGDTDVCEVEADDLRTLVRENSRLGDLILTAFMARRQILEASGQFTGLRVIGSRFSQDTFRIRDFLAKNRVPHTWLDLEADATVDGLLRGFGVGPADTPIVACGAGPTAGLLLRNPTTRDLAERVGVRRPVKEELYDLIVVGAGPAGLAAAVYGASEGLNTAVVERTAPGGQAGTSSKIENYLGFPTGVSGSDLARAAVLQAQKFGAHLSAASRVERLDLDGRFPLLHLDGDERMSARALLIATGAEYKKLDVPDLARFEGNGVYYAATPMEATQCGGAEVIVVGGGNSAGQASVFLAGTAKKVYHLIRGGDLGKSMSRYLCDRIERTANIELLAETEVVGLAGDGSLGSARVRHRRTGGERDIATPAVFTFIGAVPRTDWLPELVSCEKGFVRTGRAAAATPEWRASGARREPFLLETSRPGVFAAGDVRSGSVKRVASAVGEGSMAVSFVHEYLAQI